MTILQTFADAVTGADCFKNPVLPGGIVTSVQQSILTIEGLPSTCGLGDFVVLGNPDSDMRAEIVRMEKHRIYAVPSTSIAKIAPGYFAYPCTIDDVAYHDGLIGRVINAFGQPIDGAPLFSAKTAHTAPSTDHISPMKRGRVNTHLKTGVRAVDLFTPLCLGQRLGVFAGSGVGKSTLLAMLANAQAFDAVVISLVGERSREVREFVEDTLGEEGLAKSIVVVATSDESAIMRKRAPLTAMKIARQMAMEGKNVLFLGDSLTRYAHALREVAILLNEPPVARGYPSSVFTELPRLLEMAGPSIENKGGSVTAIVTVLVDGDDHNDPVADNLRGILDGHIVLDRELANRGRLPSMDPLASISRLAVKAWNDSERVLVTKLKNMIALYEDSRDLRLMGGYQQGSDPELDNAIAMVPKIYEFLKQNGSDTPSKDVFSEFAEHLKTESE